MDAIEAADESWAVSWLDDVAAGRRAMSQRTRASVERRGGGLDRVAGLARARGVHLAVLVDDRGVELVAASVHPFRIVC